MANAFQSIGFQHPGFQGTGGILPPAVLAELYGGGALRGRKKKKEEHAPLEIMVRTIAAEPEGKKELFAVMPKAIRKEFPDPEIVALYELIKRIEASSETTLKKVENLYWEYVEEEEDEMWMLLLV